MEAVITTATESRGRDSVESIAKKTGTDVINHDSTRMVNAALLSRDIPVHAVEGPSIVIAGRDVSVLVREGIFSVGIGCRKGVRSEEVENALQSAFAEMGIHPRDILVYATTEKKFSEHGLTQAVRALSGTLIFLDDDTINAQQGTGPSRAGKIGLRGVAEPCALATAKTGRLVLPKKIFGRVTVAIAR
jgi:cobalt-precorrin 5A hydrolase